MPISVPIGTYNLSQETHSLRQSDGFSRVNWRVHSNRFASVSLPILFSKFSVTTRLTLSVPQAEGHLITEERKLEVPPREMLRMSDTLGYTYIWPIRAFPPPPTLDPSVRLGAGLGTPPPYFEVGKHKEIGFGLGWDSG